jgi:regulator of nucleoside diphosphate kinase
MKPKIILSSLDADRLAKLLESSPDQGFPGREDLEAELDRARIVAPDEVPPTVVTMNSTVRFSIQPSSKEFFLTLVYPKDPVAPSRYWRLSACAAQLSQGRNRVAEPGGGVLQVRIEDVIYQPERAGDFRR